MPSKLNGVNPLVDNFMSQRLRESNKVQKREEKEKDGEGKRRYYDKLSISHLGKMLNSIHSELKEIGNQKALNAFSKIIDLIASPPDNIVAVNFTDITAALSEEDSEDFLRLFILAEDISNSSLPLKNWLNSLINFDLKQLKTHLDLTEAFLENNDNDWFYDYLNSINRVVIKQDVKKDNKNVKINKIISKFNIYS
ncbi:MAG: hypothetical protein ACQEQD_06905 [Bacillota bacterium]